MASAPQTARLVLTSIQQLVLKRTLAALAAQALPAQAAPWRPAVPAGHAPAGSAPPPAWRPYEHLLTERGVQTLIPPFQGLLVDAAGTLLSPSEPAEQVRAPGHAGGGISLCCEPGGDSGLSMHAIDSVCAREVSWSVPWLPCLI